MGQEKRTSYQIGMTTPGIHCLADQMDLRVPPQLLGSTALLTFFRADLENNPALFLRKALLVWMWEYRRYLR